MKTIKIPIVKFTIFFAALISISISGLDCECSKSGINAKPDFNAEQMIIDKLISYGINDRYVEVAGDLALIRFEVPVLDGEMINIMMDMAFHAFEKKKDIKTVRIESYYDKLPVLRMEIAADDIKLIKKRKISKREFTKKIKIEDLRPLSRLLADDLLEYNIELLTLENTDDEISLLARYTSSNADQFYAGFFLANARIIDRLPWIGEINIKYVYGQSNSIFFSIKKKDMVDMLNKKISQEEFAKRIEIEHEGNYFAKIFPGNYTKQLTLFRQNSGIAYAASSEYGSTKRMDEIPNKKFGPWKLFDNSNKTCWTEGAKGDGVGESIYVTININDKALKIVNGHSKSTTHFKNRNRVKKLKITTLIGYITEKKKVIKYNTVHYGKPVLTNLADSMEQQTVLLNFNSEIMEKARNEVFDKFRKADPKINKLDVRFLLKLEIMDVYKGKYNDTCISEISFAKI